MALAPLLVGTVIAIIIVIAAALLLWGVRNVVSVVVTGRAPPSKEPPPPPPKMTVTPTHPKINEGPPRLPRLTYEEFAPSLNSTGQIIDDPSTCTVWNINNRRSYSFTTPGLATHPSSTDQNPKCILTFEGGANSLLIQGIPTCAAQPNKTNWINPLIPVAGGAVRSVQNERVNSLDRCVVELDPNQFNSYSAFDYAVANAGSILASGAIQKASTLNSGVSDLTTSTNQIVDLTQNISNGEIELNKLSSVIKVQQTANSNLQNEYASRIAALQDVELTELTELDSNLITLQTQFSASNNYLSQLLSELHSHESALSNMTEKLKPEASKAARSARDALAKSTMLLSSGNAPAPRIPLQTATTFGNNGSVTCSVYCAGIGGGSWNGELPDAWQGASCVKTGTPGVGCDTVTLSQINCVCTPTGKGWAQANRPNASTASTASTCKTTPLVPGGCVNACQAAYGEWANGDNKVNIGSPGKGGICSCTTPPGCVLPAGFTQ